MPRALARKAFARVLELLANILLGAAKLDQPWVRCSNRRVEFLRSLCGLLKESFSRLRALGQNRPFGFDRVQCRYTLRLDGCVPRRGFFCLERFGFVPPRFLSQATRLLPQLFDARFELLLLGRARTSLVGRLTQSRFNECGLLPKRGDQLLQRRNAGAKIGCLAFRLFDFDRQASCAEFNLSDLFTVEGDPVFGAIEIDGGLAEQVLRLS